MHKIKQIIIEEHKLKEQKRYGKKIRTFIELSLIQYKSLLLFTNILLQSKKLENTMKIQKEKYLKKTLNSIF